ncbi:MAG: exodeoxyribonuclease VII large subunit [Alphaproteobacteria bacterium]
MNIESSNTPAKSNVPEFSVGELAFSLKRTLEDNFSRVRVRGELSRVSIAGSGHMYSSLKDDDAVIDAVCWKGVLSKLDIQPEEGLEVICIGKISSYPKSSKYQLIIESMELAGEGALLKMLEERKKKLAAEGLFAPEQKQKLPFLPRTIGVVTSPTGAVIRDILHRLDDRMPTHVLLWPVIVQGNGAADQIANAINGFNEIAKNSQIPKPDLLIVARGGGSLEDLMAFNEENVVRATAESKIPVISAVGHETDTTLIDYASDLRAPTPTGAAEKAVPVRAELLAYLNEGEQRLTGATHRMLTEGKHRLEASARGLGDPTKLLDIKTQNLDLSANKLSHAFGNFITLKNTKMIQTAARLQSPLSRLDQATQALNRWQEQLDRGIKTTLTNTENTLSHMGKMLNAYSFENTLQRGFAVIRTDNGKLISNAETARTYNTLNIQFKDNKTIDVHLGDDTNTPPPPRPKKKKTKTHDDSNQQTLF